MISLSDISSCEIGHWKTTVTDAHCHPTDHPFTDQDVQDVGLGGIAAMATRTSDQSLVRDFGKNRPANRNDGAEGVEVIEQGQGQGNEVKVVSCFGKEKLLVHGVAVTNDESVFHLTI